MDDSGTGISVIFDSSDVMLDESLKNTERVILGYVFCRYDVDADLSLVVYYKRDNTLVWENSDTYTMVKADKRFLQKLPPGLSVIDAYVKITGDLGSVAAVNDIQSLKLYIKPVTVGKYGG